MSTVEMWLLQLVINISFQTFHISVVVEQISLADAVGICIADITACHSQRIKLIEHVLCIFDVFQCPLFQCRPQRQVWILMNYFFASRELASLPLIRLLGRHACFLVLSLPCIPCSGGPEHVLLLNSFQLPNFN